MSRQHHIWGFQTYCLLFWRWCQQRMAGWKVDGAVVWCYLSSKASVDISSRSSFHTTHGVEAAEHSSGVPTIGPQPFHHPRHPKLVAGSPGCSQCCCLMSCYLGCFVVRREACRSVWEWDVGGTPLPKVPGCRLEKESPLRIFRTNRWDVEGSLGKILGPRIFLEILGPNWTKQHALQKKCQKDMSEDMSERMSKDMSILLDFGEAECPSNPRSGREWDVIIGSWCRSEVSKCRCHAELGGIP